MFSYLEIIRINHCKRLKSIHNVYKTRGQKDHNFYTLLAIKGIFAMV